MTRFLFPTLWLAAVLPLSSASMAQQPTKAETAESRLAQHLCSSATTILRLQPLTPLALDTATGIMSEASTLAPDDVELWRITLKVADFAENDELQERAIREIARLDPSDNTVGLRRMSRIVDNLQTVEERIAFYERLLKSKQFESLGKPIASRLIFDYALLLRREGRVSAFSEQLAKSVTLDPSNTVAASFAVGYFNANVKDAFGQAELLVNLFLADPTVIETQAALAQLSLDSGAYHAAVRMYDLLSRSRTAQGSFVSNSVIADRAVALWGAGRGDEALRLIDERQARLNAAEQVRLLQGNIEITPMDVVDVKVSPPVVLASVRAAILDRMRDPLAKQAQQAMIQSYEKAIETARGKEDQINQQHFAASYLELAMISLWMTRDADRGENYVQQAEAIEPLSDAARARFDGWIALCRGNYDDAASSFSQADPEDSAAQIGIALVQLQQKQSGDAARNFLAIARRQPGTLMGVWSANMLFNVVGQPAPISDEAKRINALINAIPMYIDRFPERPSELVNMRITAASTTVAPFQPFIVNLEIINNALFPLAITPTGPIQPQVLIIPTVRVLQQGTLPALDNIMVDIDRRLRLEPKQRIVIPIDLRRYSLGAVLRHYLLTGAFVRFEAIWNFQLSQTGSIEPGLLGGHSETLSARSEGVRVNFAWLEQAVKDIEFIDRDDDLNRLIMLTHVSNQDLRDMPAEEQSQLRASVPPAVFAAYEQLDPVHKALVLSEMALSEPSAQIIQAASASEDRLVRLAYLLNCVRNARDPMIDAAKRSDDPLLQNIANQLEAVARASQPAGGAPGQ